MGRHGETAPVPAMDHVANQPIAHHVLDALRAVGVDEVAVAASERSEAAVRECVASWEGSGSTDVHFVHQPDPVDFASAVRLAASWVGLAPCIVHPAGGLLTGSLGPLATRLDHTGPDAVLTVHQSPAPDQRLSSSARSLLRLAELDPARSSLGLAGVWGFGPRAIRSVADGIDAGFELPAPNEVDLTGVARRIASAGGMIHVHLADGWRTYRGDAGDLLELNRTVLDQISADIPQGARDGNRIEGRVRIHEDASVSSSVLIGPVVIGPGARIADSYIGPYTAIGAGARIEGTEIERSIVSAGASVMHVGARLTSSVIGREARMFRDFSLPRALRVCVADGAVVALP